MNKYIFLLLTLFSTTAFAAEKMKQGDVLKNDSIVFTLSEAKDMAEYISKLEETTKRDAELIELKDLLLQNKEEQILTFEEYKRLQNEKIANFLDVKALDEKRINTLERQIKMKNIGIASSFAGGALVTTGLILLVDKLNDNVAQ